MSVHDRADEAPAQSPIDLVVLFAGGSEPTPGEYECVTFAGSRLPDAVIAADSGADHAQKLGVGLDLVVGDFDSISDAAQVWIHREGIEVRPSHPTKDFSDLELAMEAAMELNPKEICVLGLGGGRPDHALLNLVVLADERWSGALVTGAAKDCWVSVVRGEVTLRGAPGSLVTLVPIGGEASVSTSGLVYPLDAEVLSPTAARGLSNLMAGTTATVFTEEGVVLTMQPAGMVVEDCGD